MVKVALVLESEKLKFFKKNLESAGFNFAIESGPVENSITIKVETESPEKLGPVIQKAYNEAKRSKLN